MHLTCIRAVERHATDGVAVGQTEPRCDAKDGK